MLQTEYNFILPKGYIDQSGNLHRNGIMRLATAADEIFPLNDPRVVQNEAYITLILLSRVIIHLGTLQNIDTNIIENLFAVDLKYLQEFYQNINQLNEISSFKCPNCGKDIEVPSYFLEQEQ